MDKCREIQSLLIINNSFFCTKGVHYWRFYCTYLPLTITSPKLYGLFYFHSTRNFSWMFYNETLLLEWRGRGEVVSIFKKNKKFVLSFKVENLANSKNEIPIHSIRKDKVNSHRHAFLERKHPFPLSLFLFVLFCCNFTLE